MSGSGEVTSDVKCQLQSIPDRGIPKWACNLSEHHWILFSCQREDSESDIQLRGLLKLLAMPLFPLHAQSVLAGQSVHPLGMTTGVT